MGSLSFCNSNDKFIVGSNEAGYDEKYFGFFENFICEYTVLASFRPPPQSNSSRAPLTLDLTAFTFEVVNGGWATASDLVCLFAVQNQVRQMTLLT